MRIGKVIGRVTLSSASETLAGGRFLVVEVQDRFSLSGRARRTTETLVVYDHLGGHNGDLIAFAESREACMPFLPEKRVPIDAYNGAILDRVSIDREV
jgi:microcompartment protein CcmK/EutM